MSRNGLAMGSRCACRAESGYSVIALQDFIFHLDTSFLIRVMDPGSPENGKLRAWIREGETFSMGTVAWAKFLCGPLTRSEIESAAEIFNRFGGFTPEDASVTARRFNDSGMWRGSSADCIIAATARGARAPP